MSLTKIEKLTPEQEALIPIYREKWKAIAFSTEPINHQKVKDVVKAAYATLNLDEPAIVFFDSPYAALYTLRSQQGRLLVSQQGNPLVNQLRKQLVNQLQRQLVPQLETQLVPQLETQLVSQLVSELGNLLASVLWSQVMSQLESQLRFQLWSQLVSQLVSQLMSPHFDFCFSVLNCDHDPRTWSALQSLVSECGWIFPYDKICLVCDRPIKLSFDSENRLHAEGEPAIEFADGYSLYSYQGVTLPGKYGKLPPHSWRTQWLLEEKNAELRRVLIQGIGYARICQELKATKLDSWAEYTLLKIDNHVDVEPICLLKMTCPSTGFIHALRVPPHTQSAREAIRWVNWGTDPDEFIVQT